MSQFIPIIFSGVGVIIGSLMVLHIGGVVGINLFWPLIIGLTMGAAVGFAFLFNVRKSEGEQEG